jgi:septal ring factor EnvC (AmiA/AmiB activator)
LSDVTFTSAHLAVLAAVLGPLLTAIGVLFRSLLAAKDAHLKSKDEQIARDAKTLEATLTLNQDLTSGLKEATAELRELRADLWQERRVGNWRKDPS